MTLTMKNGLVIWHWERLFRGNVQDICSVAKQMNCDSLIVKVQDGLDTQTFAGVETLRREAERQGLAFHAWMMMYAWANEANLFGNTLKNLSPESALCDVESQWEARAPVSTSSREAFARKQVSDIRRGGYSGPIGLCSHWKPSVHPKTPVKAFLEGMDYIAPMCYPMGSFVPSWGGGQIADCLDEYARLAGWTADRTYPMLAAFAQDTTIYVREGKKTVKKTIHWNTTPAQMLAAYNATVTYGCPGRSWWSYDFLIGGPGNPNKNVFEVEYIDQITSIGEMLSPSQPVPDPDDKKVKVSIQADPGVTVEVVNE